MWGCAEGVLGQTSLSGKKPVNRTSWGQLDNIQLHDSNGEKCLPHHCVSCQGGSAGLFKVQHRAGGLLGGTAWSSYLLAYFIIQSHTLHSDELISV